MVRRCSGQVGRLRAQQCLVDQRRGTEGAVRVLQGQVGGLAAARAVFQQAKRPPPLALPCDLTDPEPVGRMVETVEQRPWTLLVWGEFANATHALDDVRSARDEVGIAAQQCMTAH